MSIARNAFIERTEALQTILADPISVDSRLPARPNSPAALIRNGCMVMLFCALESFIRDRAIEVLGLLDRTTVPYGMLPEAIKIACVVNTFSGLLHTTRYLQRNDRIQEFERIIPIASAGLTGTNYRFSEYAFGKDKSNLGQEDIKVFGW